MELSQFDCKLVGERISTEVRKYMENYYKVWKKHNGMISSSNSGNLKKLQECLYLARGGKRIKLDTLGYQVRGFMEHGLKPEWY